MLKPTLETILLENLAAIMPHRSVDADIDFVEEPRSVRTTNTPA